MICRKCGNQIPENIKFCPKCGTPIENNKPLVQQTNAVDAGQVEKKKEANKKNNLGLKITALILCIAVLACGIYAAIAGVSNSNEINDKNVTYINDFPILKNKTEFMVYDAEQFPVEEYEIKVERFLMGGSLKNISMKSEVFTDVSDEHVYNLNLDDGDYRIILKDVTATRTHTTTSSAKEPNGAADAIVIIIDVKVDNDNEEAVDKVDLFVKPTEGDGKPQKEKIDPTELYKPVLDMYYEGILSKWDDYREEYDELAPEGIGYWLRDSSYEAYGEETITLSDVGYSFADINGDGQPELFIGLLEENTGCFSDLYTISNGKFMQVAASSRTETYTLAEDNSLNWSCKYEDVNLSLDASTGELWANRSVLSDWSEENRVWFYTEERYCITKGRPDNDDMQQVSEDQANEISESFPEFKPLSLTSFADYKASNVTEPSQTTEVSTVPEETTSTETTKETEQPKESDVSADAVKFNGHHYKMYDSSMTWKEAKAKCESMGGHLITITTQGEQEFAQRLIQNGKKNQYWIGLDTAKGWVTGETLSYTNWDYIEPNRNSREDGQVEQYVHMYRIPNPAVGGMAYGWNDMYNDNTYPGEEDFFSLNKSGYICEWE